jgi:hypothetical protein
MELPNFLQEQKSNNGIRVFRDEQIRTTWKISSKACRIYKKADDLYAQQDIKYDQSLTETQVLEYMITRATKYRNRIIKAGGFNSPSTCMPGFNRFYSL